jgi:hypothetical protein
VLFHFIWGLCPDRDISGFAVYGSSVDLFRFAGKAIDFFLELRDTVLHVVFCLAKAEPV